MRRARATSAASASSGTAAATTLYDAALERPRPPNGWTETPPFGAATVSEALRSFRDELFTYGLFLDTGGHDTYRWDVPATQAAKDDATWTRKNGPISIGFGLDEDAFPPAPPAKAPSTPTPR